MSAPTSARREATRFEPGTLYHRAAGGARWMGASSLIVGALQLVQITVLARMLTAPEYGQLAIIAIVLAVGHALADLGTGQAIVRRPSIGEDELSSLHWLNTAGGVAVCLLVALASAPIAALYGAPSLRAPLAAAGLLFLVAPLGYQMELRLQRALRFERLALGEIAGVATEAAVTSAAALAGEGVLSFVWGILAGAVVRASVLTVAATRAAWPRLVFRRAHVRAVAGFGAYQVGERLLNLLNSRLDALLIGAMLGTGPLGIYAFAFGLAMQPVGRIVPIVARVALPVFARVQDDAGRMRAGYLVLQEMLAAMLAPMLLGLAAVAPRLVPAVFGPRWEAAVPVVQLLAAVGLLRSLTSPAGPLLIARGRADLGFRWNLALLLGTVGAVTLGASAGGAVGVAVALLVLQAVAAALTPSLLLRALIGPCLGEWARHIALPIGLAALMAVAVLALGRALEGPALVVVAAQILAGAALYVGALLATSRPTFDEVVRLLTGRAVART